MRDIFEKIATNKGPLGQYGEDAFGYYMFPKLEGEIGHRMIFGGRERIIWSLNNYLALANHPEVRKVDAEAAARWGPVSYTHLRAHETVLDLVCRLLLEKKKS